ncbi:uncharacterized protein LOC125228334 isoform X1 [Leguminivora glycinivorella]|uniref:uncharacterized protein LOC125228334 isoform X1 n=1 Tax=Leguminivora glycinivorella TaxID=1035111 RepID=UPI00200BA744|nr:uncharacterized protein LOC125228334 isoform X1 [Leguminivora glycinivorella]XP_047988817.1 uncharacterized protein LOC125228334 isoform X1 [Leguminivora glycinivorella]
MVRNYKPRPGARQYKKYDPEIMKKAYREVLNGEGSLNSVAKKYNISKSCLYGRIHYNRTNESGGRKAFTLEREEHIVKYIHVCAPWQYQLQVWDLQLLIKFYLDRRPVIARRKLENNVPGTELVSKLIKRQEDIISHKVLQSINDNGAVTIEAVHSYFHELKMLVNDLEPQNIVCFNDVFIMDEIVDKKSKEREFLKINNMLVMLAASATGEVLDPVISYKEKPCYEKTPRKSIMSKHLHEERKRLNTSIFEDWFKSIIVPYFEGKSGLKCLISCYFSSRITKEILGMCRELDIHFVFLPDNSSSLTHPLYNLSQLIQSTWSSILPQVKVDSTRYTISKQSFLDMTQNIIANATETVLEGFEKTGIKPFNPEAVFRQLPGYNEITIEDVIEDFEENDEEARDISFQVKTEIEYSDQYSDDDYDDEISSNLIEKSNAEEEKLNTDSLSETKHDDEMPEGKMEFKMSPVDFEEGMTLEDASIDYTPKDEMVKNDFVPKSSRGRKLKLKRKHSSDAEYVPTDKSSPKKRVVNKRQSTGKMTANDSTNSTEIDPLSSGQSGANLHIDEVKENGTSATQTQLLEAILTTVNRQTKLQERATVAMETQATALSNIATLLERLVANNTTGSIRDALS